MKQQFSLNGYWVNYDDQENNISYGIYHLQFDLDPEETIVYIDEAKRVGKAQFEDNYGRNYSLTYNSGDYSFSLNCLD